jgi:hypothetical protein
MRSSIFTLMLLMVTASPNLGRGGNLTLKVVPTQTPIIIPAAGGSFDFRIVISNKDSTSTTTDLWALASRPDGSVFGPVWGPVAVTLQPKQTIDRKRTQEVPGFSAIRKAIYTWQTTVSIWDFPVGDYAYIVFLGHYPDTIACMAEMTYCIQPYDSKSDSMSRSNIRWTNTGQSLADSTWYFMIGDSSCGLMATNPFSPTTTFIFKLPRHAATKLLFFNSSCRIVKVYPAMQKEAGYNQWTPDFFDLESGIYFYSFIMDDFNACFGKMAVVK